MKPYEIGLLVVLVVWTISNPYLRKYKIYQFCVLMIMPFIISFLFFDSIQKEGFSIKSLSGLFFLFIGGLIYQAKKFYDLHLSEKHE